MAFRSEATNLVPDDTNDAADIFVRDRLTATVERVSISGTGVQADGPSGPPSISADGRFVTFAAGASNLVAADTNSAWDVFLRDRTEGTTERVSFTSAGEQGDGDSGLTFFAGYSIARSTGRVPISADGTLVAFISAATNLVPEDTNGLDDVFIRNRATGETTGVSIGSDGSQADGESRDCALSADGRYVAMDFRQHRPTLWLRDIVDGETVSVPVQAWTLDMFSPSLSAHGKYLTYLRSWSERGGPQFIDIWILETATGSAHYWTNGDLEGECVISADGRFIASADFYSSGDAQVYAHDRWGSSEP